MSRSRISFARPVMALAFGLALLMPGLGAAAKPEAPEAITLDGTMNESSWWLLGTNVGGPGPGFGVGHEINALYASLDSTYLYLGVAGNVQFGNRIVVLIDSRTGGYANGNFGRSSAPQGLDDFNSGTTFDAGFLPDYALVIGTNNPPSNYFWDLYTLSGTAGSGGGPSSYLGDQSDADLQADPANSSLTRGFESRLTYNATGSGVDLQVTNATIKFFAFYTSDGGFLSNQFISRANSGDGNYGSGAVTFGAAAPNPVDFGTKPSISITVAAARSFSGSPDGTYPAQSTAGVLTIVPNYVLGGGSSFAEVFFRFPLIGPESPSVRNWILNADGGPGQNGAVISLPNSGLPGGNNAWNPGETLQPEFRIGIMNAARPRFTLSIDIFGTQAPGALAAQGAEAAGGPQWLGTVTLLCESGADGPATCTTKLVDDTAYDLIDGGGIPR